MARVMGHWDTAPSETLRPPPGHPRFPRLDALRGLAAASIAILHCRGSFGDGAWWTGYYGHLAWGVGVFFVISGFLLYRPMAAGRLGLGPAIGVRAFYRRRAARILPGYWTALLVLGLAFSLGVFGPQWWRYFSLTQAYSGRTFAGGLLVSWSLSLEAGLYVLLPLAAWLLLRRARPTSSAFGAAGGRRLVLAVVGLAIVHVVLPGMPGGLVARACVGAGLLFASGALLGAASAAADARGRPGPRWPDLGAGYWIAALALVVVAGALGGRGYHADYFSDSGQLLLELGASVMSVLPALRRDPERDAVSRMLTAGPIVSLGVISYGVYLWHDVLIYELRGGGHHQPVAEAVAATAAGLGLTLAVATVSYRLVEAPVLRRVRRA